MGSRNILIVIMASLLAACGGGGNGGSLNTTAVQSQAMPSQSREIRPAPAVESKETPKATDQENKDNVSACPAFDTIVKNRKTGTPSSYDNAVARLTHLRQNVVLKPIEDDATALEVLPIGPPSSATLSLPIASTDTMASKAWRNGWTGKDVKLAVVDDYCDPGERVSHGEITRGVVLQVAPEADVLSYHTPFTDQTACPQSPTSELYKRRAVSRIFNDGVNKAFEAAAVRHVRVINASFSIDAGNFKSDLERKQTSRRQDNDFLKYAQPSSTSGSLNPMTLMVFSAGNDGEECEKATSTKALEKCNVRAAAIFELRKTLPKAGDRVMFVGAVEDHPNDRGTYDLTGYSKAAGEMKNDFIVAHDDIWKKGDRRGTSYSTPRVAGTAALVAHKWPDLKGADIKQVLLLSADDLGDKGVDAVFGHGKLNAASALSPIGGLGQ